MLVPDSFNDNLGFYFSVRNSIFRLRHDNEEYCRLTTKHIQIIVLSSLLPSPFSLYSFKRFGYSYKAVHIARKRFLTSYIDQLKPGKYCLSESGLLLVSRFFALYEKYSSLPPKFC